MTDTAPPTKPGFLARLSSAGKDRSSLAMLLLGLGAGLPYSVLTGTLNAWFTQAEVEVSTIGVLSWIGLAYAFKFLWSPALHRTIAPLTGGLGARRGWMVLFQAAIVIVLAVISLSNPTSMLSLIAVAALVGVIASASQDIVIDAWRIEVARDGAHLDTLSTLYQFGYRIAAIIGGAGALFAAARLGWNITYGVLALMMGLAVLGAILANEPKRNSKQDAADDAAGVRLGSNLPPRWRDGAVLMVMIAWGWALFVLGMFMVQTLMADTPPNARIFIRETGPWIVAATVLVPAILSAVLIALSSRRATVHESTAKPTPRILDIFYRSILEPLMDIVGRLGWAAPLVLVLILSYRFADLVWGAFAYPFYLGTNFGALGHTLDEVGLASKLIGALITIGGIALGGLALKAFGRMNCLIAGACLAAATNLLFWDLAASAGFVDGLLSFTHAYDAFATINIDERLARLITAIAGENLAVGFASVVFVAYLSSIVNPKYAAVQYALLASLTMLIGTLGRGALGELIEERGFAYVFVLTAILGLVAVIASVLEALRRRFLHPKTPITSDI
jgi:MFS transporter, PAT family, beta-lactamase induction signal transducer AmpG